MFVLDQLLFKCGFYGQKTLKTAKKSAISQFENSNFYPIAITKKASHPTFINIST